MIWTMEKQNIRDKNIPIVKRYLRSNEEKPGKSIRASMHGIRTKTSALKPEFKSAFVLFLLKVAILDQPLEEIAKLWISGNTRNI